MSELTKRDMALDIVLQAMFHVGLSGTDAPTTLFELGVRVEEFESAQKRGQQERRRVD